MEIKQSEIESKFDDDIPDYCKDCELLKLNINIKTQKVTSYCPYNCIEKLGNNAEPIPSYPDDDPLDEFHSSSQCHEWQLGGEL